MRCPVVYPIASRRKKPMTIGANRKSLVLAAAILATEGI
jgi:hypothetical protein